MSSLASEIHRNSYLSKKESEDNDFYEEDEYDSPRLKRQSSREEMTCFDA